MLEQATTSLHTLETGDLPLVSVIVPVFNDAARLAVCLAALERQTYPGDRYEVLVVDNGSDQSVVELVGRFPHAAASFEGRPGSYAARNAGLARARGAVLAFTDSDCVPAPDWIAQGVRRLASLPNGGLIAGRVDLFYKDRARPNAVELYERVSAFPQRKFVEKYHFGATANVFTYAHVVGAVGQFNADLLSGGDREWGQRVHAAGYGLAYADDVCVAHPARASLGQLYAKAARTAGGLRDLKGRPPLLRFAKSVVRDVLAPWKDVRAIVVDRRLVGPRQKAVAVLMTFCVRYMLIWIKLRFQWGRAARVR